MIINTSLKKKKKKKNNRLVKSLIKKELPEKLRKDNTSNCNEWVNRKETGITSEVFQKHFSFQRPSENMLKSVYETNDKKKNSKLVNVIKSGLSDLKNEIGNIGEEEKGIEKPSEIIDIVEKILEFNKEDQQGQGLKILTPDQILSRLPITLAQLKAGNNSQKLLNEIRELFHLQPIYNLKPFNQRYLKLETSFMNTENSKTNEPHRFRLSLADKLNLKNLNKNIALGNLSIYYTWKNIKSTYNNNKFKISAPIWNDTFDLPYDSYSIADIQDYFEFII